MTPPPSTEVLQLRPEAQAAGVEALDRRQQRGFEQIMALLEAAARDVKRAADSRTDPVRVNPYLMLNRASRTALVPARRHCCCRW
jgi:hypothetical protein